ncbi:flagellar hook protein FlgE [Ideonella sp. B7]|uniref:flagellar hook protein FlgE n=1 Tax=Ideonella benzenivorans TaxID=2831643 RepID=UPI001CEC9FDB|nr:flagellar hook protein FlgE [Ideonella benzenivorans]MCA6217957.1 flagellar hook protein FlgE [Ideonella benzenivorans]
MSFQQGLSGLNVMSKNLDVIGNNIANASTVGAKSSRAEFADLYANALNGSGAAPIGIGVQLAAVAQQFTQGNITATDNAMDVAINGNGFFQMNDPKGEVVYSRNGQFKVNNEGFVVNNQGQQLMGYAADSNGNIIQGPTSALQLPTAGINPQATSKIGMEFNLDSREKVTDPGAAATPRIDFTDSSTFNQARSMTVYDAKGQPVALSYYYQKAGDDTWNLYATANGEPLAGTAANPQPVQTLTFSADGSTVSPSTTTLNIPASTNAAGASTLAIGPVTLDISGSTQYGSAFGLTDQTQDGFAPGQLTGVSIDKSGVVLARYSNGQTKSAGQIEIATFRNVQGLTPAGGNAWHASIASGQAIKGVPGSGNLGVLQSGAVEDSNVDLTGELVNMITAQRNYQANAQTIKTMDQVMQTLVNLR